MPSNDTNPVLEAIFWAVNGWLPLEAFDENDPWYLIFFACHIARTLNPKPDPVIASAGRSECPLVVAQKISSEIGAAMPTPRLTGRRVSRCRPGCSKPMATSPVLGFG